MCRCAKLSIFAQRAHTLGRGHERAAPRNSRIHTRCASVESHAMLAHERHSADQPARSLSITGRSGENAELILLAFARYHLPPSDRCTPVHQFKVSRKQFDISGASNRRESFTFETNRRGCSTFARLFFDFTSGAGERPDLFVILQ